MTSRRRDLVAAAVLALFLEPGCVSLWAIQRPPSPPIDPREPLECTRAVVAPVVDTGIALGIAGGLVAGWAGTAGEGAPIVALATLILAIPAALSTGSAAWGFAATARCRELDEALDQCLKGDPASCGMLTAPSEDARPREPSPAPAHAP